jgi:hypothetical protein
MKQFPGAVVAKLNIGHMGTATAAPAPAPISQPQRQPQGLTATLPVPPGTQGPQQ